ncbi:NADP-dependent malic enzyme [Anaeromyxobacter paludicola]|uniref:Bifunctional malic enzyme oxidoreductase/phosphotransacetylase n=1 Tax=Anaeromyxobacter paludicola TaxID=2918171 RepID=A0ABM7XBD3_9BACT|nr:NADP-dependent malic enzyme [Anaeromyxobacter paludicola]BDG09182.1 bifunctional malic enzyme oxidoreductase/phosphotransacetylase [Anaeromyxobacter paludicola]
MATDFTQKKPDGGNKKVRREDALAYHSSGRKGKIEVVPTKPCSTARDLALAYSPGVAEPCLEIAKDEELSYQYTARGNLVAVVSNGTAVLGLGDIGPAAGKPVMEGKGVLFKKFADVDVFDINISAKTVDEVCQVVRALEPTFGGINLEDIKAPECFMIEERLKREMNIPVFHDDQHGTAIISGAALLNALAITGKEIGKVRVVVSGAGASAIACTKFYLSLGVRRENVLLVDTKGVVYKGRTEGMNQWKAEFAADTRCRTLADAMEGADVFLGCSVKGLVTQDMVRSMAKDPIVFALANPDPEISYPDAVAAREDVIMATGRSDYPNQVNNVLGFPFIFRGALDVRAKAINEEMKMAAARALAAMAREEVPESVSRAYGGDKFSFGRNYIIPKPLDPRALLWVAPAVAKAAIDSGVARVQLSMPEYVERLKKLQSRSHQVMGSVFAKTRGPKRARIVFPEGHLPKIQQAAAILRDEGICEPILLGPPKLLQKTIEEQRLEDLAGVTIIDPIESSEFQRYVNAYYTQRQRHGVTLDSARKRLRQRAYFGSMMVHLGEADGLVTGLATPYPEAIRVPLEIIRTHGGRRAGGVNILVQKNDVRFFADCTVNVDPTAEELAEIAISTASLARFFGVEPRVAMLSYSSFGSARGASPAKVRRATEIARAGNIQVDGEIQVDLACSPELRAAEFPFSTLQDEPNVFVFPNLDSANIAYQLLERLGGAEVIGPVLLHMAKPVNILQMGSGVQQIVNLAAVTAARAVGGEFVF